ncbi:MAG TPA: ferric reductase [Methylophaga sp.]|nr:ferric reductase [Methylophaga sp.]
MKNIKYVLLLVLLLPTVLWLFADSLLPNPFTYFSFRAVFVQYTGVMAMTVMSIAMLLALRPKFIEPYLKGLDKMYRLHKWLGISALVFATSHWWFAKGTKWMVGWGWLARPERRPRTGQPDLPFFEGLFRSQRGLAETIGEWAFYAVALLIVLALVKRFPYRWFAKTHNLLAVTYLLFVYHAVILIKFGYWSQPIGWLMATLLAGGFYAAIWILLGKVGAKRKVKAEITALEHHHDMGIMGVTVKMAADWPGHQAGQFAFAMSDKKEGAHPYTIASTWDPATRLVHFMIKALGDHTGRLSDKLSIGMPITMEGPYGTFNFNDDQPHQIWIGAGIGITPFMARMKELEVAPDGKDIDFFHLTRQINHVVRANLLADVEASKVKLHLTVDNQPGRLDADQIRARVPNWQNTSVWFCGPAEFGETLRKELIKHGLDPKQFHQELFTLR